MVTIANLKTFFTGKTGVTIEADGGTNFLQVKVDTSKLSNGAVMAEAIKFKGFITTDVKVKGMKTFRFALLKANSAIA